MAKELPYFRFTSQEWQNGDVSIESYELKGIFIDICAYYWIKDCSITLALLEKRFKDAKELIKELIDLEILHYDSKTDFIQINFLNEQYDVLSERRKRRQVAGSIGGKQKSSNAKAKLKQNPSYKDKDKYNNKDKDNIPIYEDFEKFVLEKDNTINIQSLKNKYNAWVENGWKDGKDKKIKNWKSKILNTLTYLPKEIPTIKNTEHESDFE